MPRRKDSLLKYRKHRGTGQAVVTLSGRDHYLGKHGTAASRREYDRLIGEWLTNGRQSLVSSPHELSVVELFARYLQFAKSYYVKDGKPTKELAGMKDAIRQIRKCYSRTLAAEFGQLALKAVRQQMIDAGWARNTVNKAIGRVKRIFRWAASEQLIPAGTYEALATVDGLRRGKSAAPDAPRIEPANAEDIAAVLPHLPPVIADMVRVQRLTGMRPGEVCIMRPCDLDRSGDVWLYSPSSHKTEHHGRERTIYLGPQSQAIMLRDAQAYALDPFAKGKQPLEVRRQG